MTSVIIKLKISSIEPDYRCICDAESIDDMVRQISAGIPVKPLEVRFTGRSFRILEGEIYWRACKKLGMKEIQAVIVEDMV